LLIIEGKKITRKNQPSKKKRPIFLQSGEGEEKKKEAQLQYTNDFVKKKKGTLFLHGKTNSQGS
jgi:hypothetical protein